MDRDVMVPLEDFPWQGGQVPLPGMGVIGQPGKNPVPHFFQGCLSKWEWSALSDVEHWWCFRLSQAHHASAYSLVNLLLTALWVAAPTRTSVRYIFEWPVPEPEQTSFKRICDTFYWVQGQVQDQITIDQLQEAMIYFEVLRSIASAKKRLMNGVVLTVRGATSYDWRIAIVCWAAAFEAILTYSRERGVTRRLAQSYACLAASSKAERDIAFRRFVRLYDVRSGVMHGEVLAMSEAESLQALGDFSEALRTLWRIVLSRQDLRTVLEQDDAARKQWLLQNEGGYDRPPK